MEGGGEGAQSKTERHPTFCITVTQVANANAAWRQNLCEKYFTIWAQLRRPSLTAQEEARLRATLALKAKQTQCRSVPRSPLQDVCSSACVTPNLAPIQTLDLGTHSTQI